MVRGGADTSLARPGRKQITAKKHGIYSTFSPRNRNTFLTQLQLLLHTTLKNSENCLSNQVSVAAMTSASEENSDISIVFQSREQVVVRRGQIRRTGWVIKSLAAQVGQFLLGCKCPVRMDMFVQKQEHTGGIPSAFFLPNVLQLQKQR